MHKNTQRRRPLAGGVGLTLTAMLLAGCAGGTSSESSASAETDPEGTISVGVRFLQNSWDPSQMPGATIVPIYQLVYDNLIGLDADLNLVPGLAEEWDSADGGTTWDLTLRQDTQFNDGTAFGAEDVKATLEYYAGEGSNTRADLAEMSDVEVVDDHHLRITLTGANVGFPEVLAGRAGLILSSETVESGDFASPVGTGEYLVENDVEGVQVDFVPNPDHWNPETVNVAGLTLRWIEDPVAMANAIRSQEIDMAVLEPSQADAVEAAGLSTYEVRGAQLVGISLNPDLAPELADPQVRMALAMAIDRDGIVNGLAFGRGAEANQFIAPERFGFNSALDEIPYDIEGARKLLAEAGYPEGFSYTMAAQANNRSYAEAIQASWAEIGVDVELTFPPGAGVAEATWTNPTIPIATQNLVPDIDATPFLWRHLSTDTVRNPGSVEVPGLMDLIQEAQVTADEGEREQILQETGEVTRETIPAYIPVMWRNYTVAYSEDLVGVEEWQAGYPILDGVGVKK
ncbi:ABC transporter substrate-binding protein [Citricoccus sp. NPDC055426]|uniref:ABC transporter substrate-binding protein n=1 Tax=Citricoccus sp. NPDC055426 TaxID=3155536 RepID=UPI003444AF61